jgi:TolB-like protein
MTTAVWYYIMGSHRSLVVAAPTQFSIAVLPFANLSDDPTQDRLVDGITENITTELSRSIRGAFVIARDTSFSFKGKDTSAKSIGQQLGVQYVLEGSVHRAGNQVRIYIQLLDVENVSHIWADQFEGDLVDSPKLRNEIVARLARALHIEHCTDVHRAPALTGPVCQYASHLELCQGQMKCRTKLGASRKCDSELIIRSPCQRAPTMPLEPSHPSPLQPAIGREHKFDINKLTSVSETNLLVGGG